MQLRVRVRVFMSYFDLFCDTFRLALEKWVLTFSPIWRPPKHTKTNSATWYVLIGPSFSTHIHHTQSEHTHSRKHTHALYNFRWQKEYYIAFLNLIRVFLFLVSATNWTCEGAKFTPECSFTLRRSPHWYVTDHYGTMTMRHVRVRQELPYVILIKGARRGVRFLMRVRHTMPLHQLCWFQLVVVVIEMLVLQTMRLCY